MTACVVALAGLSGCRGWGRLETAAAFNTDGRPGRDGALVGLDGVIGLRDIKWVGEEGIPLGVHSSLEGIIAPNLKSFGWGTGFAAFFRPRPIAPYAVAGSILHVDSIDGKFSFGGGSPYGEVGLVTPLGPRDDADKNGTVLTLGFSLSSHVNFLTPSNERTDGLAFLKVGIGYEKN